MKATTFRLSDLDTRSICWAISAYCIDHEPVVVGVVVSGLALPQAIARESVSQQACKRGL